MLYDMEMVREKIMEETDIVCAIQPTYIDYGAGWMEDTVVSIWPREYQILCPRDVELAVAGMLTEEAVQEVIAKINKRGW